MGADDLVTRRRLLIAGGLGAFGLSVGAMSVYDPKTLRYVGVENRTDSRRTVHVRVEANGNPALERELDLGGNEHVQLPCEWPVPARSYRVGARRDGDDGWKERPIRHDGDAYRVIAITEDRVELRVMWPGDAFLESTDHIEPCEVPWWVEEFRAGTA